MSTIVSQHPLYLHLMSSSNDKKDFNLIAQRLILCAACSGLKCALKCHSFLFMLLKVQRPLSICHQVNEHLKPSSKTFNYGKLVLYRIGIEMSIIRFPIDPITLSRNNGKSLAMD